MLNEILQYIDINQSVLIKESIDLYTESLNTSS